jgi:beta-lactamase superfamily II metal-dependent hydrolase
MPTRFIDQDRVNVKFADKTVTPVTLFWGDPVEEVGTVAAGTEIKLHVRDRESHKWAEHTGLLPAGTKLRDDSTVLKVRFVDVGQGDGAIIESPGGKLILVDGGEGENFRRYVAVAFDRTIRVNPLECHTIIATHGDADHYEGLVKLMRKRGTEKRAPVKAARFLHNGLVKRKVPAELKGEEKQLATFGAIVKGPGGAPFCGELVDDLTAGDASGWSPSFQKLRTALEEQRAANPGLVVERLEYGQNGAFADFAAEGVEIEVLGPVVDRVAGKPALPFLSSPEGGLSASHTVNGHSVVLKVTLGNVRFLFGADLNEASEERLLERAKADGVSLQAEVLKVPHHGSHEFRTDILAAIEPVVSIVSSGDENVAKDFIHPRAGLMGALGKYSRKSVEKPLVFVTEMVAFFNQVGNFFRKTGSGAADFEEIKELYTKRSKGMQRVRNAYAKSQFGIVHARTDGKRLLVITHSGKATGKELYTFTVGKNGKVTLEGVKSEPDDGEE